MRKNKKLLLAAIASMGVLAMGVGATSSFAWYAASHGAVSLTGTKAGTISTSASEFGATNITVTVTDVNSKLDKLVLSDTSGKTYGWINGGAVEADVPTGFTTITPVKWGFSAAGDADAIAAAGTYYVSFEKSNSRIRTNDTAATHVQEDCYTSIVIGADGLIALDEVTLYVSVDGGDSEDTESVGGTITATLQQTAFSSESTYSVGDVVIYSNALYRCSAAVTVAGDWTNTTNWTAMNLVAAA